MGRGLTTAHVLVAGGTTALSVLVAVFIAGSFVVLGVVCWIFWRAARQPDQRDREHGR